MSTDVIISDDDSLTLKKENAMMKFKIASEEDEVRRQASFGVQSRCIPTFMRG